ncbi:MAG: UvrD-helicase domain-containing protein [Clostridia bacterium]|nr:UvrD-helicase domain-containing protein [Clostridia bacterium]
MSEIEKILNLISPKKQADEAFFKDLLDGEKQRAYEDGRIRAVMLALKALHINKLKNKISDAKRERDELNSSEHNAENYKRVIELNAEINRLNSKVQSFKPFFDEPYFARMDLIDNIEGYNSYYIGKRGDEGLEIVDWRAPLARRYYQKSKTSFKINDYDYKLILRRALRTAGGKVLDMKNEYLSVKGYLSDEEIAGRDEAIIFDPFLKEILENRKEKREICDIIETIQEKQYEIITLPEDAEFILQGVAGSGKTMIMLHRLSYILYNNEELRPSDVLVVTPSDSFNAFIDELAQILELERVKTSTLDGYFLNVLKNSGVNIEGKIDYFQPIPPEFLNYAYTDKFVLEIRKKLAKIYDGIHGMFVSDGCKDVTDGVLEALENQEEKYVSIKNAGIRVRRCVLGEIKEKVDGGLYYTKQFRNMFNCISDVREFLQLLSDERMNGQAFFYRQLLSFYKSLKFLRKYSEKICLNAVSDLDDLHTAVEKEISDLKRYKINVDGQETLTYSDRIEKREQLKREIIKITQTVKDIADEFIPLYDFADVLRGENYLVAIGKCETTYDILRFFYRETVKKIKTRFSLSSKKLCRTDPYSMCLILNELGLPLSPKYRFIFVDEAQDISLNEYRILQSINDRAAFNIFGDLKQNITPYRGIKDWAELGYKQFNLNLNYRNTNRIVEYVSESLNIDMQAIGTEGSKVEEISKRSVTNYLSEGKGLSAVITSEEGLEKHMRKSYNVVRDTGRISKTKINIMTVYESKGLEFTSVAVADAGMSENEKYIAYTRALKNLAIIR